MNLALQEFDLEIRDKKGLESLVANHLSCLEPGKSIDDTPIEDKFLDEQLWEVKDVEVSWYADYVNFIISIIVLSDLTFQQKKKFFAKSKYCYREDPLLFRCCADGIMRRCVGREDAIDLGVLPFFSVWWSSWVE